MAFAAITSTEIQVGKPVTTNLFTKIKDNFDDHESRITATEAAVQVFRPITFDFLGQSLVGDNQAVERVNFNISLLSARIFLIDNGSSGTLTVDIEKSTNSGASWASIFSTLPSITSASPDYSLSTNQVFSTIPTTFNTGDLIRINLDSVISGSNLWQFLIDFEAV